MEAEERKRKRGMKQTTLNMPQDQIQELFESIRETLNDPEEITIDQIIDAFKDNYVSANVSETEFIDFCYYVESIVKPKHYPSKADMDQSDDEDEFKEAI